MKYHTACSISKRKDIKYFHCDLLVLGFLWQKLRHVFCKLKWINLHVCPTKCSFRMHHWGKLKRLH